MIAQRSFHVLSGQGRQLTGPYLRSRTVVVSMLRAVAASMAGDQFCAAFAAEKEVAQRSLLPLVRLTSLFRCIQSQPLVDSFPQLDVHNGRLFAWIVNAL